MSDLLNNWEVELAGIGLVGGSLKDIWLLLLASCFDTFSYLLSIACLYAPMQGRFCDSQKARSPGASLGT